jgi:hypothetical protein
LLIANGRLGKDRHIGSLTCTESSTVDYCILSPVLFSCVANFEICSFDRLISDVHNALHLELLRKNVTSVENDDNVTNVHVKKKSKWDNEKCQLFDNSLCDENINTLIEKLFLLDIDTVDKVVVNDPVDECSNIIRNAAVDSELLSEYVVRNIPNVNRKCRVNKPWFNRDCYEKRKLYHRARNLNWGVHNAESKNNLLRCSKAYTKVLNTQHNLYHKGFIKKLRGLRHNDSKSY